MKKLAAPGRRGSNTIKAFKSDHDELVDEIDLSASASSIIPSDASRVTDFVDEETLRKKLSQEKAAEEMEIDRKGSS